MFPARAGVILDLEWLCNLLWYVPRASGGDPREELKGDKGTTMFPARAGVILGGKKWKKTDIYVPRASGGDPRSVWRKWNTHRCSPRERG